MGEIKNGIQAFYAKTKAEWRAWLAENHEKEPSVWLIIYKKGSLAESIPHSDAVDEALCYGWIDSLTTKRDEESRFQLFSKRKAKSNWSAVNKNKVTRLIEQNLMSPAGLKTVEVAKENGMWDALNDVENGIVPEDLEKALRINKKAYHHWTMFPPSAKKAILKWVHEAKRVETREKRIAEAVKLAAQNIRANQP